MLRMGSPDRGARGKTGHGIVKKLEVQVQGTYLPGYPGRQSYHY